MKRKISRRTFLKKSAGLLTAVTASSYHGGTLFAREYPDIAVVEGENPVQQTRKSLEILGGMKAFVRRADRAVILPDAEWRYPGAAVNPEIAIEVARLCGEAGAGSITITTHYGIGRWGSAVAQDLQAAGVKIKVPSHPKDGRVRQGKHPGSFLGVSCPFAYGLGEKNQVLGRFA